jgi:DNA-binding NtrC family response regulator
MEPGKADIDISVGDEVATRARPGNKKVLVIEEDVAIGELLGTILKVEVGCETEWVRTIPEDVNGPWYDVLFEAPRQPDLVMVDLSVVYPHNMILLENLIERGISLPPVVVMSDAPAIYAQQAAARINAVGLIVKPFDIDTLIGEVNRIFGIHLYTRTDTSLDGS